jgi:HAD superfamily phosphoserine phosphatase-like hydrolase
VKVFISYARQDIRLKNKFRKHLKALEEKFSLTVFDDRSILPGEEWEKRIWCEFRQSRLIVALVSPNFIASEFCLHNEFAKAIERHKERKALVLPILLRPCGWTSIPSISQLQILPDNGEPIAGGSFRTQDLAFANVINGMNKLLTALAWKKRNRRVARRPPKPNPDLYANSSYKAVFFDLDGTIVRGRPGYEDFRYSWQLVWKILGYDDAIRRQYYFQYYREKSISYQEWCDISRDLFRDRGLRRDHFKQIARKVRLTKNCKETLRILQDNGFVLSIVSGGIDTFLEAVFPDYFEFFDYVFINKFRWDETGVLRAIETTPYDFDGKFDAIRYVSRERDIPLDQCVFVGEGRNDVYAAVRLSEAGGLTIGYPPNAIVDYVEVDLWKDRLEAILDVLFSRTSLQRKLHLECRQL